MIADQPTNERQARGREMVEEFLHCFAEKADYRALACHAALPLMLTPELLKYLRHEFLPHLSWVAEVDLLLSKLCDEAAEGVYVMKRDARAYLIRRMREDKALGEARIEIVNRMLIERLDYLARNHSAILSHEWRTQRLSAMLYVTEQRDEAARELAETIYRCLTDNAGEAGKAGAVARRTELARLTRLVREEAANLQDDYPDLARLAQLIGQILADRSQRVIEDLRASGQLSQQFQLPGVDVRAPLLEYVAATQGVTVARDSKAEERVVVVEAQVPVQLSSFKYACYLNYHADAETANRFAGHFQNALTRELSSLGIDKPIFVASRNLASDPFYSESLTKALYESACYIALWSRVYQGNESLERDMESVRLLEKMRFGDSLKERGLILPVLLSAPESAPESLRNIQWVDFSKTISSPRWFSTKAFRSKIRDIAEFVLNRCREAEQAPEAFAGPQDFALQVEATDLMWQARGAMNFGRYDQARAGLARALKIHRDRQDRDGEILALKDLGEVSYGAGEFARAFRYYSEALEIARSVGAHPRVALLLDKLESLDESGRALQSNQESLEISRNLERDPLSPLIEQIRKNILGESPSLLKMVEQVAKAIPRKDSLLLIGESGTGKELIARAIHHLGPRHDAPFVAVQVSAIHEREFEREMFGREPSEYARAFTGAEDPDIGFFEQAGDGTLFLDEIGDLSASSQIKLLQVIDEKKYRRLHGKEELPFNARLVCATHHDLDEEAERNRFRLDLFHRIGDLTIHVPPLRERKGDIEALAWYFLNKNKGERQITFADETLKILCSYPFPGNVRELANIVKSALRACVGEVIAPSHLPLVIMGTLAEEARTLLAELQSESSPTVETRPDSSFLSPFEFETVTLDERGEVEERRKLQARQFFEELTPSLMLADELTPSVTLAMVEIPGGKFSMGSPENEVGRINYEGPQHDVTVLPFYIGKFAITQAEWRVVAGWEKVERGLKPDPSRYKGDDCPVDGVSWEDAKEFCARLAKETGRLYRLPSEAEWEYACRAGTTTPFAFGETVTPEIVNYNGMFPYAKAKKGMLSFKNVPVGSLGVANAFGLFDMHGNVWEWCEDVWHDNYNGAPTDGSAWLSGGDPYRRVRRGGSPSIQAGQCRSAARSPYIASFSYDYAGFRVVVSARTS